MELEELCGKYHHLREALDQAYTADVWDSQRIDRITEEMLPIEKALASLTVNGAGHAREQRP